MEITINYYRQAVSVSVEVYEYLTQANNKAENLAHEQQRRWNEREFGEYIIAAEGRLQTSGIEISYPCSFFSFAFGRPEVSGF